MKKRVLLGMSGGVDSSVSAIILKDQGYEVIGATMKLWTPENEEDGQSTCCGEDSIRDAKRVCDQLDIPHYVFNLKKEFQCNVVDNFIKEYEEGRTPNPCIECNRYLKFRYFYQKAKELGCEYIATGHYAKREYSEKYKRYVLKKSSESKKDQTYFLYNIPREEIKKVIFPLQDFPEKDKVRQIAEENGLLISQKKDSQEICFIGGQEYTEVMQ